jgi:CHAT domain-containing protein/predicted negative regulator of RcsB-dependent stress response
MACWTAEAAWADAETRMAGAACGAAVSSQLTAGSVAQPAGSPGGDELMQSALDAYRRGALEAAVRDWLAAARRFAAEGQPGRQAGALARAAEAHAALGFVGESQKTLEEALELSKRQGDAALTGAILGALARGHLELGRSDRAAEVMDEALAQAVESGSPRLEAAIMIGRGDLLVASGDAAGAAAAYTEAEQLAAEAGSEMIAAQAAANAARAMVEAGSGSEARSALARALERARATPDSDAKAQVMVHVGASHERLAGLTPGSGTEQTSAAAAAYGEAVDVAQRVGAQRSAAFALGSLGHLYERAGRNDDAIALTRRAVFAAQAAEAPEALYRWQWQLGRLLRTEGQIPAAIDAHRRAVRTLDAVRTTPGGGHLAFDEDVEPVYFGLVDLLLRQASATSASEQRSPLLAEARDHLESLKSAELREYFRDPCFAAERTTEAGAIPGAVIVYPVILPDRTELIVSRPEGLTSVVVPIPAEELNREIYTFRDLLRKRTTREYRRYAAKLYDRLMRPLDDVIGDQPVDALVFVPGGALRTIPMAALYDREAKQFLIEKHPIAVIPALHLTDPRPIDRNNVRTLAAGLTLPVQGFPALAAVGPELAAVAEVFGGSSLVDDEFLAGSVENTLAEQQFGIVHVATHGQFEAEASDSFLLTYDGRLGIDRLAVLVERTRFRDQPIELLTLSACETAVGDDQAALGLAGVAIRAGARSALATLWTVNDVAAGQLIAEFYRQLAQPGASRARALQQAQISLLNARPTRHPGYWAPFMLISNWM